ncbi:MAG: TauD/TfdA family dioxygenase [Gammaproteobacteria bacterium]|nr:TauD/TfdA family dioxygenase [Gammaproteobacteria bacterium]
MKFEHISLTPASPAVGAFVEGVQLSDQLSDATLVELRLAHAIHGVLFFRDQTLTPEQHIDFAEQIGDINVNRFFTPVADHPKIAEVRKEPEQTTNIGGGWHTDHSYDQVPALGSILYSLEVPPIGGDTIFTSMYAAYEALSDGMKETLSTLNGVHSSRHVFGASAKRPGDLNDRLGNAELATQDAIHPVIITHPRSGQKALYVNPGFTVCFEGWTAQESEPLLTYLYRHAVRPEFSYRFHWLQGSVAFWDNRCTWHNAVNDYHGERRLLHRITLEGEPLVA